MKSNLVNLIKKAIEGCIYSGRGYARDPQARIEVCAEWVPGTRPGYSIVNITIRQGGVVKFSYDDYGTECKD